MSLLGNKEKKEISELKLKIENLTSMLLPEQMDIVRLREEIKLLNTEKELLSREVATIKFHISELSRELESGRAEVKNRKRELIELDDEILYQEFGLFRPLYNFATSEQYKLKLDGLRQRQKEMVKNKKAVSYYDGWTVNGSVSQGKKMTNDNIQQILRSFNTECENAIDRVKFNNFDSMKSRILKSFETLNKLNATNKLSLKEEFLWLKLDELNLAIEYSMKKQEEKEEQKRIRAELREQAKLEQEVKQARDKIAKERKHFNKAIDEMKLKINATGDKNERQQMCIKLAELQSSLNNLDKEESLVDYREKNAKAGYVYVISNIGAFGEGVFKIGMTRRLEPQDRIDELGDASVPFTFDVHALIFSDNAPELESKLHQHFYKNRINKMNSRKEFYRADIKEIERVIRDNYNKVLDMVEVPPAEQYRQSLLVN